MQQKHTIFSTCLFKCWKKSADIKNYEIVDGVSTVHNIIMKHVIAIEFRNSMCTYICVFVNR